MLPEQEPKYRAVAHGVESLVTGHLVNRASGEAIPHDEPVFIFRARDKHAVAALMFYRDRVADASHMTVVSRRIKDFHNFRARHPDRMKEPDSP